jgi:flagellar basal-body rod protein FlgG
MLYQSMSSPGADSQVDALPVGIQIGTGVRLASASKLFNQGVLMQSSSDLDFAIEGEGFFQVSLPDGTLVYTRDGNLHMDATGNVVTNDGYSVVGFPALDTNASSVTVSTDGTVSVFVNGQNTSKGRITLARFANPEGMTFLGRNLYAETEASGSAQTGSPGDNNFGMIAQHYLEASNVDIVKEMVDMIAAQRAYELNSKGVKTADEMLRMAANLKN